MRGVFFVVFWLSGLLLPFCARERASDRTLDIPSDKIIVYGTVTDGITGKPVEGAEITVLPLHAVARTDENGFFKISFEALSPPLDANLTFVFSHPRYVSRKVFVRFSSPSGNQVIYDRIRRLDVSLFPPVHLSVDVLDERGDRIRGAEVAVLPSPEISEYLGTGQGNFIFSATSDVTSPVEITRVIPFIYGASVFIVAFPPSEDYGASSTEVRISEKKIRAVLPLSKGGLKLIWTSADSGQVVRPDEGLTLIFSDDVSAVSVVVECEGEKIPAFARISGKIVKVETAGKILGRCNLKVVSAFGADGQTLEGEYSKRFVAYDPTAPSGFACAEPQIYPEWGGAVTEVMFDSVSLPVVAFHSAITFTGFFTANHPDFTIMWRPVAVDGILTYRIYKLDRSDALGRWKPLDVLPEYRVSLNAWFAKLSFAGDEIRYGKNFKLAVVPVNLNGEEICNPANAPWIEVRDALGPAVVSVLWVSGDYSPVSSRTLSVLMSEPVTYASVSVTSRTFSVRVGDATVSGDTVFVPVMWSFPLSFPLTEDAENSDGDNSVLVRGGSKLWAGEIVTVYSSGFTLSTAPLRITAVLPEGSALRLYFDLPVRDFRTGYGGFSGGRVVPDSANLIQAPAGRFYVKSSGVAVFDSTTGLSPGDRLQVLDVDGEVKEVEVLKVVGSEVWLSDTGGLDCKFSDVLCVWRSKTPDIVIRVFALDTSGNPTRSWADESSHDGKLIW